MNEELRTWDGSAFVPGEILLVNPKFLGELVLRTVFPDYFEPTSDLFSLSSDSTVDVHGYSTFQVQNPQLLGLERIRWQRGQLLR